MTTYVMRPNERGGFDAVPKTQAPPSGGAFFMPDIAEFRTMDGTAISSRSHLRAYEQRHQVRQIGDMAKPARPRDNG